MKRRFHEIVSELKCKSSPEEVLVRWERTTQPQPNGNFPIFQLVNSNSSSIETRIWEFQWACWWWRKMEWELRETMLEMKRLETKGSNYRIIWGIFQLVIARVNRGDAVITAITLSLSVWVYCVRHSTTTAVAILTLFRYLPLSLSSAANKTVMLNSSIFRALHNSLSIPTLAIRNLPAKGLSDVYCFHYAVRRQSASWIHGGTFKTLAIFISSQAECSKYSSKTKEKTKCKLQSPKECKKWKKNKKKYMQKVIKVHCCQIQ